MNTICTQEDDWEEDFTEDVDPYEAKCTASPIRTQQSPRPMPSPSSRPSVPVFRPLCDSHPYYLHLLVYRTDLPSLKSYLACPHIHSIINSKDHRGNTALSLAIKLCHLSPEYARIVDALLKAGADPKLKDAGGWSALDEATASGDRDIVKLIFDHLHRRKMRELDEEWRKAHETLKRLPDFYTEIRWEFDSSYIPLLKKILPHDTCLLWKIGSELRLDTTLVSWRKLVSKRRQISILFRNPQRFQFSDPLPGSELVLVNYSKRLILDPLQDFDAQERNAVMADLMRTDPMKGEMVITDCEVRQCTNWLGRPSIAQVYGYTGKKYDLRAKAQGDVAKRGHQTPPIRESDYFEGVKTEQFDTGGYEHRPLNLCADRADRLSHYSKQLKAAFWMSEDFPISLQDFLPVLNVLSSGSVFFSRIADFLNADLLSKFPANTFPIKLEIPISMGVRAVVQFTRFEFLSSSGTDLMRLPVFKVESRRLGQKTLSSPRKRQLLVTMLL